MDKAKGINMSDDEKFLESSVNIDLLVETAETSIFHVEDSTNLPTPKSHTDLMMQCSNLTSKVSQGCTFIVEMDSSISTNSKVLKSGDYVDQDEKLSIGESVKEDSEKGSEPIADMSKGESDILLEISANIEHITEKIPSINIDIAEEDQNLKRFALLMEKVDNSLDYCSKSIASINDFNLFKKFFENEQEILLEEMASQAQQMKSILESAEALPEKLQYLVLDHLEYNFDRDGHWIEINSNYKLIEEKIEELIQSTTEGFVPFKYSGISKVISIVENISKLPMQERVHMEEEIAQVVESLHEDSKDEEGEIAECENEEGELVEDEHQDGEQVEGEHKEQEVVEGEREERDDDDAPVKPLDGDEDRRNPQYIPRKGCFYQHDDRNREEMEKTAADEPVDETEVEKPKKKRSEANDRWGHDMFDPNQQGPKSDQELVDLYGYNIRRKEGVPRARSRQPLYR